MKQVLRLTIFLVIIILHSASAIISAQEVSKGIRFEEGKTWADIKEKAKKENKYIFIDGYTTWCTWCKWADKNIFSLPEVGEYYNKNFVSVKVQFDVNAKDNEAIKRWYEEAKIMKEKYKISSYPMYLFLDADGKILHRLSGAPSTGKEFIELASVVFDHEKQYYALVEQLNAGQQDSSFLINMVKAALKADDYETVSKASSIYIRNLKDPFQKNNIEFILRRTNSSADPGFTILLNNPEQVKQIMGENKIVDTVISGIVTSEAIEAAMEKESDPDWNQMTNILSNKYPGQSDIIKAFVNDRVSTYKESKLSYLSRKKDLSRFQKEMINYVNLNKNSGLNNKSASALNGWAWTTFLKLTDRKALEAALVLSKASFAKDSTGKRHGFIDTYANLLYKLYKLNNVGSLQNAIEWEKKALQLAKNAGDATKESQEIYEGVIAIMEKGEKNWEQPQIIVGPNIQVNNDGNFTHFEYMFSANPVDPENLMGGIVGVGGMKLPYTVAYISQDGGNSWNYINMAMATSDPETAFSSNGTAYFVDLGTKTEGSETDGLTFHISSDKGKTWKKSSSPNLVGKISIYDHPQLAVDHTRGKTAGYIYISVSGQSLQSDKENICWLLSSKDNGKSFEGPRKVVSGPKYNIQTNNLLVSSKGALFFFYNQSTKEYHDYLFVSSNDAGASFSAPKKVVRTKQEIGDGMVRSFPQYAIDSKSRKYLDRLYCVFDEVHDGRTLIMLTYSTDGGKNWSKPKAIDLNTPSDAHQSSPAIAVNSKGVIGIRWFDTRGTKFGEGFNEYFTASLDGGNTFLPAARVSSQTSYFTNEMISTNWRRLDNNDSLLFRFSSRIKTNVLRGRGDYFQFAADAKGTFHDFWPDSRDGRVGQVYTSAIRVGEVGVKEEKENVKVKKEKEHISAPPQNKNLIQIARYIYLQMDTTSYDSTTNILSIPVRIKNTSDKPIYGPIKIEISRIDTSNGKSAVLTILNQSNKQEAGPAQFIYDLGDSAVLLPGAETETMTWKLKVKVPYKIKRYSEKDVKELGLERNYLLQWFLESVPDLYISVTGLIGEDK